MGRSWYTLRTSLALFLGVLLVSVSALHIDSRLSVQYEQRLQTEVHEDMVRRSSLLSASIEKQVSLLRGLEAYVSTRIEQDKPISEEGFLLAVKTLTKGSQAVRNMIIAPGGINTYVYPLEANEAAVGHDLLSDQRPEVQQDIARALRSGELTLSGPYQLRQGGLGLVARKALFEDGEFWGLVTMVIDMPPVLLEADLYCVEGAASALCESPLVVALLDQEGRLISGDGALGEQEFDGDAIRLIVSLPEGVWTLLAIPRDGWASGYPLAIRVLLYLVAGLLIILFSFLFLQARWLRQQVEQKTESLRMETEANRRQSMLLERTLRSIDEGVVITDSEGRVSSANRKALDLSGSPDGGKGSPFHEVYPITDQDDKDLSKGLISEVLEGREPYQSGSEQLELCCVNQAARPVELSASPILLDEGPPVGVIVILHDVRLQREASRQLQNAQRLESLGILAGGIAHDFNNLLGGVYGFIELAASSAEEPQEVRYCLKQALDTLPGVRELTGELLTFSRGGSPVKRPIDLLRLLEDASRFLDTAQGITLSLEVEEPLWECLADPDQLVTVFTQLLKNAQTAVIKRGGIGSVTIKAGNAVISHETSPLLDAPACLKVSIIDTGCGISPGDLDKVFDPFYTTGDFGSGLGLTVAYSIIRSHGGDIRISSNEPTGTRVVLYLPALAAEHLQPRSDERPAEPAVQTKEVRRVLVMDDEPIVRVVATDLLRTAGLEVENCSNGDEALKLAQEAKGTFRAYDAILLDLNVADGPGGRQVVSSLRELLPQALLIASSGYHDDQVICDPKRFGFDSSLRKPYTYRELKTALGLDSLG